MVKRGIKMGTLIVGLIVLGMIVLAFRRMFKNKKQGKSIQCGSDCKNCGGHCH